MAARHTFAQLGAGTFVAGTRTVLAAPVVVHPTALRVEARRLADLGVPDALDRLAVSADCRVITPYHQALNRLRELARGEARHGSCGVGVGEAVADALAFPEDAVRAGDLRAPAVLTRKLSRQRARALDALAALAGARPDTVAARDERAILEDPGVPQRWIAAAGTVAPAVRDAATLARWLAEAPALVFEGAQGVLLDGDHGLHPHTTWSDCTSRGALDLLARFAPDAEVRRLGVLRTHLPRHGAGPLPTETGDLEGLVGEHNAENRWQGKVRLGWLDAVLLRHALAVNAGVDALVLTHGDLVPRLPAFRLAVAYELPGRAGGPPERVDDLTRWLAAAPPDDLAGRAALTARLARATPIYRSVPATLEAVVAAVEEALGVPVALVSRGPTAADLTAPPRAPGTRKRP